MNIFLSSTQIIDEFQSADFVLKTQKQIAKDFTQFAVECDSDFLNNVFSYDSILLEIQERMTELMKYGEQTFLHYLYQVDIPEVEFINLLNDALFLPKMSELILKREAYKVYLRSKY